MIYLVWFIGIVTTITACVASGISIWCLYQIIKHPDMPIFLKSFGWSTLLAIALIWSLTILLWVDIMGFT